VNFPRTYLYLLWKSPYV